MKSTYINGDRLLFLNFVLDISKKKKKLNLATQKSEIKSGSSIWWLRITNLFCDCTYVCSIYVWNKPFSSPKITVQTCQTFMYLYYLELGLLAINRDPQWVAETRRKFISLRHKNPYSVPEISCSPPIRYL